MKPAYYPIVATFILAGAATLAGAAEPAAEQTMIDRGRYIARIAGCNDCHTPNYATTGRGARAAVADRRPPGLARPLGHDLPEQPASGTQPPERG